MPNTSRRLLRVAVLMVVTAVFLWLFLRQADLGSALTALAALPPWSLFASVAAVLANLALVALRWRVLLAGTLFAERLLDGLVLAAWLLAGTLVLGIAGPLLLAGVALSAGSALGLA